MQTLSANANASEDARQEIEAQPNPKMPTKGNSIVHDSHNRH